MHVLVKLRRSQCSLQPLLEKLYGQLDSTVFREFLKRSVTGSQHTHGRAIRSGTPCLKCGISSHDMYQCCGQLVFLSFCQLWSLYRWIPHVVGYWRGAGCWVWLALGGRVPIQIGTCMSACVIKRYVL